MTQFESIYLEYQPKILRYLTNLTSEQDAPDLAQTVFLKVSRSLDSFRGDSSLSTWIYRIATNTAHDHASSAMAQQKASEQLLDDEVAIEDFPDHDMEGSDAQYIRREMNACIRGIVDQLPEKYRAPLLLSEFEELGNAEIAEILSLNLDTVKIRLHRARTRLRKAMQCQCNLYHDDRNQLMCDRK